MEAQIRACILMSDLDRLVILNIFTFDLEHIVKTELDVFPSALMITKPHGVPVYSGRFIG